MKSVNRALITTILVYTLFFLMVPCLWFIMGSLFSLIMMSCLIVIWPIEFIIPNHNQIISSYCYNSLYQRIMNPLNTWHIYDASYYHNLENSTSYIYNTAYHIFNIGILLTILFVICSPILIFIFIYFKDKKQNIVINQI